MVFHWFFLIVGNYLRVRGEYSPLIACNIAWWELPPRTRRILAGVPGADGFAGTTSAYAENTAIGKIKIVEGRNYLRVRGEYQSSGCVAGTRVELPPRTRRIPWDALGAGIKYGTTSAYAENTLRPGRTPERVWNYLRVRGEYSMCRFG